MGLVVAASNTMNEKNIRMSTAQALDVCTQVIKNSAEDHIISQVYIATAWECPFEGAIAEKVILDLADTVLQQGADGLVIADTIGAANPAAVKSLTKKLVTEFGAKHLACHFHDTRGMGVANVYAALEQGIRHFDASIGGLGGCPFAPGATGNVATEDVVLLLQQMGFDTGIDLQKLIQAADLAAQLTGNCQGGRSNQWLKRQFEKARTQ